MSYGTEVKLTPHPYSKSMKFATCPNGCLGGDGAPIRTMVETWSTPVKVTNRCGCHIVGSETKDTVRFYPKR